MLNSSKYLNTLITNINYLSLNQKKISFLKNLVKKTSTKNTIFICGNGGSSANAEHISNDFMLGLNKKKMGAKIINLSSNSAKITCIANDLSYEEIYSHQLKILGKKNDLLICLSGSGNSQNIINAIKVARTKKIITYSILGYSGGTVKKLSDYFFHFPVNDMQISEDMQLILMNTVMKKLFFHE